MTQEIEDADRKNKLNTDLWKRCGDFLTPFTYAIQQGGFSRVDYDNLDSKVLRKIIKPNINIADVGCYTGTSTSILAGQTQDLNGIVYAIDWFEGSQNSNLPNCKSYVNYRKILEDNLKQLNINNVTIMEMTSEEASKTFKDEFFDIVFLDADHRYQYIKKDIELWYPKVKHHGFLVGHDCEYETMIRETLPKFPENIDEIDYINELRCHPGVIRAVLEKFSGRIQLAKDSIWWVQKT